MRENPLRDSRIVKDGSRIVEATCKRSSEHRKKNNMALSKQDIFTIKIVDKYSNNHAEESWVIGARKIVQCIRFLTCIYPIQV